MVARRIRAFVAFWYNFLVGDDWRVAVAVVIALGATYALSATRIPAWWILPATVAVLLPVNLWPSARAARARNTGTDPD